MCAVLFSLMACAQVDNVYCQDVIKGYDDVIQEEQVVKNTLVRHQQVINYYHVNEVKENHYFLNHNPYYGRVVHRHYTPRRTVFYTNTYSRYPHAVNREYSAIETPDNYYNSYEHVENVGNKWFFYFQLNSDYLTNKEELGHLIDYAKTNYNAIFYIDSYADAETGSQEYNMDISKRRANAIINILLNEGINKNRLFVRNHGCYVQEYKTNNFNRCVTVKSSFR